MKKTIVIAIVLTNLFLACKKDRTCSCSMSKTGTSTTTAALTFSTAFGNIPVVDTSFTTPVSEYFSYDRVYVKTTRRAAKNDCLSYTEPYQERAINEAPPLQLTTDTKGERKYTCELK